MDKLKNEMENSRVQMVNSKLEQNMAEMQRSQAELVMAQAEFSRSMADMDYSQVGLARFHVRDEIRSPLQETMTNLEATMAELRRSQAQFTEKVNTPPQEESIVKRGVDELAIAMAKLAKSTMAEIPKKEASVKVQIRPIPLKSLEEENTPKVISCTKSTLKKEQPLQEKGMSVQELVENYINEGENMVEMSFKGQQKNLPSNLEVIKEEKNLLYNEDITSRNDEELEKLQRVQNDA